MLPDCRYRAFFFTRNSGACLDIADLVFTGKWGLAQYSRNPPLPVAARAYYDKRRLCDVPVDRVPNDNGSLTQYVVEPYLEAVYRQISSTPLVFGLRYKHGTTHLKTEDLAGRCSDDRSSPLSSSYAPWHCNRTRPRHWIFGRRTPDSKA